MKKLSRSEVTVLIKTVPTWKLKGKNIEKTFTLEDFNQAIWFLNKLALICEENNHHPDINIRWNKVYLSLTTHDSDGLTKKDFIVAKKADAIFGNLV